MAIDLTVVTPEGQAFQGEVESVVLPGVEGDFGVLTGHEVFMTSLRPGEMQVELPSETQRAAVSKGIAEVHEDNVTVMVGSCEFAHQIDVDRAKVARDRAQKQLEEMRASGEDEEALREYQETYSRAIARVVVSEKFKS
ncbi:MAG: ATP synthase F1 subunit epsilon [Planctomycetota bacterium]|jgi:F-type H+-transporting ATPase subunit epsilon|nr:ATP synthase F1 subunit epsilon [Deltaproteobacteria bacterium]MDP6541101.1 ATP synthase F1 subunit epsilon [Planctomycetota bacterium]